MNTPAHRRRSSRSRRWLDAIRGYWRGASVIALAVLTGLVPSAAAVAAIRVIAELQVPGDSGTPSEPRVAALADGDFVIVWRAAAAGSTLRAVRVTGDGRLGAELLLVESHQAPALRAQEATHAVAPLPDGGFVIVWAKASASCLELRRFLADGTAAGDLAPTCSADLSADSEAVPDVFGPDLAAYEDGGLVLVHSQGSGFFVDGTHVTVKLGEYAPSGERLAGNEVTVASGGVTPFGTQRTAAVSTAGAFGAIVSVTETQVAPRTSRLFRYARGGAVYGAEAGVFDDGSVVPGGLAARSDGAALRIRQLQAMRVPFPLSIVTLGLDRLGLPSRNAVLAGAGTLASAIAVTEDGGALVAWRDFSRNGSAAGIRTLVRRVNGMLGASGPDLVIDHDLGLVTAARGVALASGSADTALVAWESAEGPQRSIKAALLELTGAACMPSPTVACLNGNRFAATARWRQADGQEFPAQVVGRELADETVAFSFFGADNWEVMLKVLRGCGVNRHYWVLAAGATNVGYTLEVRDGNRLWQYDNPTGTLAPGLSDIVAFPCP